MDSSSSAERSDYKDGSIVRIRCHQFLTYREVTINPGPRLNIVVGPNGTGKSSIVCAIAIGLGGHPKLLGRSDNIGEFVMMGCDEGFVEIEIFRQGRPNMVIRRHLKRDKGGNKSKSESTWKLDGKVVNQKTIQQAVLRTGAQLANLCTFLPQEKVGEFSGFDASQLLRETEKAVGGPDLLAEHDRLGAMEADLGDVERQLGAKRDKLEQLKEQNKALERDKEKMEQRKEHLEKADLCEKRLLWVKFEEKREATKELKDAHEFAKEALRSAEATLQPLEDQARAGVVSYKKVEKQTEELRRELEPAKKEAKNCLDKAASQIEAIEELREDLGNVGVRSLELEKKVAKQERALAEKEAALAQYDAAAVKLEVAELKQAYKEANECFQAGEEGRQALADKARQAKQSLDKVKRELGGLGDGLAARSSQLQQGGRKMGADALKLRKWLDSDGNRGQFRRPVHGPVALDVNIAKPDWIDCLEDRVPFRVWTGFVTECEEDCAKLYAELSRQKMGNTVYNIETGVLKPNPRNKYSELALGELRALGVEGLLEEAVECSDAVKQVLRDHAETLTTAVGGEALSRGFAQDSARLQSALLIGNGFTAYGKNPGGGQQSGWTKLRGSKSAYQEGQVSITVTQVKPARCLVASEDTSQQRAELELAEREAAAGFGEAKRAQDEARAATELERKAVQRAAQLMEEKKKELQLEKKLAGDMNSCRRKIDEYQRELKELNVDKERRVLVKKVNMALEKRVAYLERAQTAAVRQIDLELRLGMSRLRLEMCKENSLARKQDLEEAKHGFAEKTEQVASLKAKFKDAKNELRHIHNVANKQAPMASEDGVKTELATQLEALPMARNEVEAIRDASQVAADAIHDNPQVVEMYNQRKREIEDLEREVEKVVGSGGGARAEFDGLKTKWLTEVENCCKRLNELFSVYMKHLGNEVRGSGP